MFLWLCFNALIAYGLCLENKSLVHKKFWAGMFLIFGFFAFPFFAFAKHDPTKQAPLSNWDRWEISHGGHSGRCPQCGTSLSTIGECPICQRRFK